MRKRTCLDGAVCSVHPESLVAFECSRVGAASPAAKTTESRCDILLGDLFRAVSSIKDYYYRKWGDQVIAPYTGNP